jgi:hypothetical protein
MASRRCWTRKNRKNSRRNRRQNGGASPLNESLAGSTPSNLNLAQGNQYAGFHAAQHGGEAPFPGGVTDSLLPRDLVSFSRTAPLDKYLADALPVRDPGQMGGRRRSRKNRKNRKASRKNRKASRKNRRNMRGGAFSPAPADAPGMLLDASDAAKAVRGMNPEWQLAPDVKAFAPK